MSERFVLDENFPVAAVPSLRAHGHDVVHIGTLMAGVDDTDVAAEAVRRDAILLTFDRDFGELTFHHRIRSAGIVLFRLGRQSPTVILSVIGKFLASPPPLRGFFTVVSLSQVRQRPLLRIIGEDG